GLSPIHFLSISMAVSGVGISTPLSADGYFTNSYCYDTRLCTPSVAMIHVMSSILKIGVPITLNATGSHGTNGPKDNITSYSWDWGDGHVTPPGPNPVDTHAYYSPANYIVTVNLEDTYNARGLASVTLSVVRFSIDLSVTFQSLSSQIFYPGDQISLPAVVQNLGTNVSTSTFRFVIQNRTLYETQLPLMPPVGQVTEHSTWNTTGLTPQSYTVAAEIDPVTAVISGESVIVENDTSNNINHVYIIIREPIPPGYGSFLGLGLPATGALGILLLAGVVWSSIFLRRRKKPVEEAI